MLFIILWFISRAGALHRCFSRVPRCECCVKHRWGSDVLCNILTNPGSLPWYKLYLNIMNIKTSPSPTIGTCLKLHLLCVNVNIAVQYVRFIIIENMLNHVPLVIFPGWPIETNQLFKCQFRVYRLMHRCFLQSLRCVKHRWGYEGL